MNKICTSIEQSEKLIELGIDINTADMYWWSTNKRSYIEAMDDGDFNEEGDTPAWSLSALLELMPDIGRYTPNIGRFDGDYYCSYMDEDGETKECFSSETSPLNAAFEMVVWLKENGKI